MKVSQPLKEQCNQILQKQLLSPKLGILRGTNPVCLLQPTIGPIPTLNTSFPSTGPAWEGQVPPEIWRKSTP